MWKLNKGLKRLLKTTIAPKGWLFVRVLSWLEHSSIILNILL